MNKYEERLKQRLPEVAKIARGLRQKAGIIDETPLDDFEVCSLQKLYETWESLMEKDYAELNKLELEQLADVRNIAKWEECDNGN